MSNKSKYTGALAKPSPFVKDGWGSGTSAVIITKMQEHIDQCMAALMRHYNIRPDEMVSAGHWNMLLKVATEHVPALAISQGWIKEVGDGNRKISELCVLIWYINQLPPTVSYGEILDALQDGTLPGDRKLATYYEVARALIFKFSKNLLIIIFI